jgi:hypothetical protein
MAMAPLSVFSNPLNSFQFLFFKREVRPPPPADCPDAREETQTRMAFISDMLHENTNAFASDIDVQSMMRLFPDRF